MQNRPKSSMQWLKYVEDSIPQNSNVLKKEVQEIFQQLPQPILPPDTQDTPSPLSATNNFKENIGQLSGAIASAGTFAFLSNWVLEVPLEDAVSLMPEAGLFFMDCFELVSAFRMHDGFFLSELWDTGYSGAELLEGVAAASDGFEIVEGIMTLGISFLIGSVVKAGVESLYEEDVQKNIILRKASEQKALIFYKLSDPKADPKEIASAAREVENHGYQVWAF